VWSARRLRRAVRGFAGAPHRLEVVRVLDGVTYVNDSASTRLLRGGGAAQLWRADALR
jgi:UDP-N-acetylmuramoylalanine-D-glutamate ligase